MNPDPSLLKISVDFLKQFFVEHLLQNNHSLVSAKLVWIEAGADFLIGSAYCFIAITLIYIMRRRKDPSYNSTLLLFSLFILLGSTVHFINIGKSSDLFSLFYVPLKILAGTISLAAGVFLWIKMSKMITIRGPLDFRQEIHLKTEELQKSKAHLTAAQGIWHDTEKLFRAFMDYSPAIAFMKDDKGRYVYVNKPFETTFKGETQFFQGKTDFDLWPKEIAEKLLAHEEGILESEEAHQGLESIPTRDGLMHEWFTIRFPVKGFAEKTYMGGVAIDVTALKTSEQRQLILYEVTRCIAESNLLEELEIKVIRMICEILQWDFGEAWMIDKKTNALRWQHACSSPEFKFHDFKEASKDLTVQKGESLPGLVWELNRSVWVSDLSKNEKTARRTAAMKAGFSNAFGFPIKSGDQFFGVVSFLSRQIWHPNDDVLKMFDFIGTQMGQFIVRKRLEEQFFQAQKMESIGRLAGGIAHDFNNLLTVILGYSGLLMKDLGTHPDALEKVKEIHQSAELASNLTRQLLAFSRRQLIEAQVFNLNELITGLDKILRRLIGENMEWAIFLEKELDLVKADPGQMEQMLVNLVVNARDAMPQGGKIIIETKNIEITRDHASKYAELAVGNYVMLVVTDTGTGMTDDVKAHIFEPFFTTKEAGKGTGLGLSTVYGIVKQNGGYIRVYSETAVGTTFKIYLPRVATVVTEEKFLETEKTARISGGNETILLVEDNPAVREFTAEGLRTLGYKVFAASSGLEALEVVRNRTGEKISLLLTDVVMPRMGGPELAEQLQRVYHQIKIIFTSGYTDSSLPPAFKDTQVWFLEKPFTRDTLAKKMREALEA